MRMIERVARGIAWEDLTPESKADAIEHGVTPNDIVIDDDMLAYARAAVAAIPGPDVIERVAMKLRPLFSDEMSRRIAAELIEAALQEDTDAQHE